MSSQPESAAVSPASPKPPAAVKESKAQRAERLKVEKNPWEAWEDVRRYAREGRESVLPEWANLYFKWWGIYTQGDGFGVTGGKGGEGVTTEFFMMRIAVPNGILSSRQLRAIGQLTVDYARNLADITTRQAIQLHWLTIDSLPKVVDAIESVGLSPRGACGDVVRNVTGCPVAGLDAHEIIDASPLALALAAELNGNPEFYNLPRKFKITASGCPIWCSYPEINDVAVTAVRRGEEIGYSIRVGGGLSKEPHLAVKLDVSLTEEQVVPVVRAIAELFRRQQGLRQSRDRARLKYLFMAENWTAESFLVELEAILGYKLAPGVADEVPDDVFRDHTGVRPQKQAGLYSVGASVLNGRLSGQDLLQLATLVEELAGAELRTTVNQNFIIPHVPQKNLTALLEGLAKLNLHVEANNFWRGTIACTGTEFCKLAITETKGFARWLVEEMETRLPGFDQQFKLHLTGCPNNCGQAWIADVGLEGKKIKHEGKLVDAWYFALGGQLGQNAGFARQVNYRCRSEEVPDALERLFRSYLATRTGDENLRAWFAARSNDDLRAILEGVAELAAV
jgi:sulfite reductase (ferredoxin)